MPTYKHGIKWRTIVTHNYKQRTKVTRTKREGELWEAETLRELNTPAAEVLAKVTFRHVLEKYRDEVTPSKRGHRWEFVRLEAYLNGMLDVDVPVQSVTPEVLGVWRDKRLLTVSPSTVLRDFSLLSAVFESARREWGYVQSNPVRDVRKPREADHRTVVISREQIKLILGALGYSPFAPVRTVSQSLAVCFLMALRTGMRAGELCNLTWSNLHTDYCRLPVTKTVPRDVPLSRKAIKLANKMRGFDSVQVFGLKPQTLDAMFRRAKKRAGIDGVHFHDARHTAATWMCKKVDLLTLCKIFGWKNTSQALTYYNPKAGDIAKML